MALVAPWLALVACKAVLTASQTVGCRSLEFDLSIADDGVFVMSHDPVHGTSEELRGKVDTFEHFVAGLKGRRFDMVNVDLKERSFWPGDGRLTEALERAKPSLAALAAQTDHVVPTSPVPFRYAELERFVKRSGLRLEPGLELADYTADDARRWHLPMTRLDAALLPLAGLASRAYWRWRGADIKYLSVQERTAAAMKTAPPGVSLLCWTRDPATGPPPPDCRWTERHRGQGAAAAR